MDSFFYLLLEYHPPSDTAEINTLSCLRLRCTEANKFKSGRIMKSSYKHVQSGCSRTCRTITTHTCMFYSCACIPCFQQISCRSRDGTMTAATGRFCVTRTFSKRAHLLVKPVNEDQLWTSEAGMVHLFLFCFAVLPSEAKRKRFSNKLNSTP